MATLIVFDPLKQRKASAHWKTLKQWFVDNPKRKTCVTSLGKIRRSHMKRDFLKFCVKGVILE